MQITVATLRAAGCSESLINRIVEIADQENTAKNAALNMARCRAYRERKAQQKQRSRHARHGVEHVASIDNPQQINGAETGTPNAQEDLLLTSSVSKKDTLLKRDTWDFELFWKTYPRRVAKKAAEKAFRKVERDGEVTLDGLLAAVRRIKAREAQFIPYPATWLNAGQYLDEAAMSNGGSYATHWKATHGAMEERLRRGWG
jgi:hypothetical protein